MKNYLELVETVLKEGSWKKNRTGIKTKTITGTCLKHHLKDGFPLLTTKKMAFKSIKVELEFFIKGYTDKKWLQERGCHIWDEWCSPVYLTKEMNEKERKKKQLEETDLGPIYGYQWRQFGNHSSSPRKGFDQIKQVIKTLKEDPTDRRMIVSAWNPNDLHLMALPPCHILFHLIVINKTLHLNWFQRSCDLMLGIPFNLASYSLLLHLFAKEVGLKEGSVSGLLSDVHIYENHIKQAKQQLLRTPLKLPSITTHHFNSLLKWEHSQTTLKNYQSHPKINFPIAI